MTLPIPFGNPATYPGHSGVDYGQKRGTPIRASGDGTVTRRGRNERGGFYIWVKYDDVPYEVGYHHMDSFDGCPPVEARVKEFDQLGLVGNTGNSTGPHLHSEVQGHATTAGYWLFHDRNRVVSKPSPEGNTTEDIIDNWRNDMIQLVRRSTDGTVHLIDRDGSVPLNNLVDVANASVTETYAAVQKVFKTTGVTAREFDLINMVVNNRASQARK